MVMFGEAMEATWEVCILDGGSICEARCDRRSESTRWWLVQRFILYFPGLEGWPLQGPFNMPAIPELWSLAVWTDKHLSEDLVLCPALADGCHILSFASVELEWPGDTREGKGGCCDECLLELSKMWVNVHSRI